MTNTATGSLQFMHFSKPPRNILLRTRKLTASPLLSHLVCPGCWGLFSTLPSPLSGLGANVLSLCLAPALEPPEVAGGYGWRGCVCWGGDVRLYQGGREIAATSQGNAAHPSRAFSPSLRASVSAILAKIPWNSLCPGPREVLVLWAQPDSTI